MIAGAPPRATDESDLVSSAVAAAEATDRNAAAALGITPPPTIRAHRGRIKVKSDSLLAQRAADEYVYVGQDLRRIVVVAGILFAALIVFWLFFTIVDPFGIY